MSDKLEYALANLTSTLMKKIAKLNRNGIYWKKHANNSIILYDCRPTGEIGDMTTTSDVYKAIIKHTVVFKNRDLIKRLFGIPFADITNDLLIELCDDVFGAYQEEATCILQYEDYYIAMDRRVNLICITDDVNDISKVEPVENTEPLVEPVEEVIESN